MSRYIDTKKYVITEYIDEHNYYRRYTVSFKNSGTYSIKFVPDGSLDLGPVDLELWKGNSCIAYEPSTELSTCIKADSTYEIWVHYRDDKPANNKYYLLIEEIESFHIDIYEPSNVYNSSNALSIQANQNIANDISSRYHHYKIQFDSDGEAVFNIKPLFEALDVKVYIYKENNLKISDTKHTYHMQVEKDKWYYINVKHNGTDDELAALTKSGHDFYLLNVEDNLSIKYTSKYYNGYSYKKSEYDEKYLAYNLTAPQDKVNTGLFSAKQAEDYNNTEYRVKEKAENFKIQLERADYFTGRVKGAIYSNMPDPVSKALTLEGFLNAINTAKEEPTVKNILNAVLTTLESIPIVSLPAAIVESLSLGPVVWSNLRNCKRYIEEIQELKEDI